MPEFFARLICLLGDHPGFVLSARPLGDGRLIWDIYRCTRCHAPFSA